LSTPLPSTTTVTKRSCPLPRDQGLNTLDPPYRRG
jgi:hypothetical protein